MTRLQLASLLIVSTACGPTPAPEEESGVLVAPAEPVRIVSWSGCAAEAELHLINRGPGPVQLEAPRWMSGNLDFVEVEGAGPRTLSPGEIAQVALRAAELPEEVAFDQYAGRLAIGGGEHWVEVEVAYSAVTGVIDAPSELGFGAVTLGDSLTLPLGRRNVTEVATWYELGPLTGDHATFPGFEAPLRVELGPKQESQLPVTFAPTTLGPHLASLRYTMALDCRELATSLTLTGTGVEDVLEFPKTLDLGDVQVGTTGAVVLTVTNLALMDTQLTQVRLDDDNVFGLPSIQPGEALPVPGHEGTASLEVQCTPPSARDFTTTLRFDSPAPGVERAVTLSCTGVE